MNILITSAGRRVSLVRSFKYEISRVDLPSKIYTTDAFPYYAPACHVSDKSFKISKINSNDYISNLFDLCIKNGIELIIPTIDTELIKLSNNREYFKRNGIEILVSDKEFIKKCMDKRKTHEFFKSINVVTAEEYSKDNLKFPLFIKPFIGSSSINTFLVKNKDQLSEYYYKNNEFMFLEYLDKKYHTEFTLDLYYDKYSELKCIVPRERIEVRGGEVSKGITRKNLLLDYFYERVRLLNGARGCITFQVFINNQTDNVTGIEINPRFGGGYPLSYSAGANYPKWIIEEYLLNKRIDYFDEWENNLLMLRYDDEILIHDFEN